MIPWIKNVSFFAELSEESILRIADISEMVTYHSDQQIFKEGDDPDSLYIIISGQVIIEKEFKEQKRKKTLAILEPGDFFGEMGLITLSKRSASAVTMEDSALIKIEKDNFRDVLQNNSHLCFEILQVICHRLKEADDEIENLAFQNLPGRIALKLVDLADQFGVHNENELYIKLDLTHSDLSDMVGTNRETISKYMSIFKKEGCIDYVDQRIFIKDMNKLMSWA